MKLSLAIGPFATSAFYFVECSVWHEAELPAAIVNPVLSEYGLSAL